MHSVHGNVDTLLHDGMRPCLVHSGVEGGCLPWVQATAVVILQVRGGSVWLRDLPARGDMECCEHVNPVPAPPLPSDGWASYTGGSGVHLTRGKGRREAQGNGGQRCKAQPLWPQIRSGLETRALGPIALYSVHIIICARQPCAGQAPGRHSLGISGSRTHTCSWIPPGLCGHHTRHRRP